MSVRQWRWIVPEGVTNDGEKRGVGIHEVSVNCGDNVANFLPMFKLASQGLTVCYLRRFKTGQGDVGRMVRKRHDVRYWRLVERVPTACEARVSLEKG